MSRPLALLTICTSSSCILQQLTQGAGVVGQAGMGDSIPPFYFPGSKPVSEEVVRTAQESLQQLLAANPTGFAVAATKELVSQVNSDLHTPRFCSTQACTLLVLWQYFQIS